MDNSKNQKRRVLVVSFHFPPLSGMGSLWVGKVSKYLPEFGWEPIVLTVGKVQGLPPTNPVEISEANIIRTRFAPLEYTVPYQLASGKPNERQGLLSSFGFRSLAHGLAHAPRLLYSLLTKYVLPFEAIGWYPYATREGLKLLDADKFKVIFSSSAPSTSHLVARYLHRKTDIPWVAEFRDLWALSSFTQKRQPFRFIEEQCEKWVLRTSNSIVAVSEPWAKSMEALHSKPVTSIHGGFDEDDYTATVPLCSKFTLTYTGNIYRTKRDPSPLFEAIKSLQEEGKIHPGNFEARFFGGNVNTLVSPLVDRYGLHALVKVSGLVPLGESIRLQKESTALLLLGWNDPLDKGFFPGKIFEYMGARRPVLGIGPKDDVVDKLIQESGMGVVLTESSEVKALISTWLNELNACGEVNSYHQPNIKFVETLTQRKQAERLARVFDEVSRE